MPFPNVEFQPLLTEIASLKPDAVFVFFAGGGAAKFIKDYAAAGLKENIPLYGSGFLTDGTLEAQATSAQGLQTTLHYGDGLESEDATAVPCRLREGVHPGRPDVYAVQGYDAALLLAAGLNAVKGNIRSDKKAIRRDGEGQDRQPARPLDDVEGAQSDPGHLSAPSRWQGEQGDRRRTKRWPIPRGAASCNGAPSAFQAVPAVQSFQFLASARTGVTATGDHGTIGTVGHIPP